MTQLTVGRTINDVDEKGVPYKFMIPDLVKLMNTAVSVGDELLIPVNIRDNDVTFWESGGRNLNFSSSIGTVIASDDDSLLDAILFNKLNKTPNGKHALVVLKNGYRLYAGRINIKKNLLAPKIKILRLVYVGCESDPKQGDNTNTTFGKFVLDAIFSDYEGIDNCIPAQRLVNKLFSHDVVKPYFANGWSVSNISNVKDKMLLTATYNRLINSDIPEVDHVIVDSFLDDIENELVSMNNTKLSAVFQWIDFNRAKVGIIPLLGVELSDIEHSIGYAFGKNKYTIDTPTLMAGYNPNMLFGSDDIGMLKMAMKYDSKLSVNLGNNVFGILRGFRG